MIRQMKRIVLSLSAGVLLSGCWNSQALLSVEARKVVADVNALSNRMESPGNDVWWGADALVRRVRSLPRCERRAVMDSYIKKLYSLGTMEIGAEKLPVWLYNFQGLLKTVDLCMDDLDDKEAPLRLYELCVDRYLGGIELLRSRVNIGETVQGIRSRHELSRRLATDAQEFFANIRKVYLPLVAARLLPEAKYEQWKLRLDEKMREFPCRADR